MSQGESGQQHNMYGAPAHFLTLGAKPTRDFLTPCSDVVTDLDLDHLLAADWASSSGQIVPHFLFYPKAFFEKCLGVTG